MRCEADVSAGFGSLLAQAIELTRLVLRGRRDARPLVHSIVRVLESTPGSGMPIHGGESMFRRMSASLAAG